MNVYYQNASQTMMYRHSSAKDESKKVPFYSGIIVIICLCGLYGLVYYLSNLLPSPLTFEDEAINPDSFIAERAIRDLRYLTNLGPRITGGFTNENLTVEFLNREIGDIIKNANKNQKLKLDNQVVSGAYVLSTNNQNFKIINAYANIQNVAVKLFGYNESSYSLLVNAHFDSVPTSPGGSDDGINVVAMLEILRKLSRSTIRLGNNVIFLFNGAEETPLQASHGFVTEHKWAKECKILINLEASGTGGKISLFQTGPGTSWLLDYYVKVSQPKGSVFVEEVFQSGAVPSDTDFRIFRDFGGMVGFDMAFSRGGYRYHTKYDNFESIPKGSYQHVGDNTLSLIKLIANAPEFPKTNSIDCVYFDIFSWFMVSYTVNTALIINLFVVALSSGVFVFCCYDFRLPLSKSVFVFTMLSTAAILLGWTLSVLVTYWIALFLDALDNSMRWYGHHWLIFGLYVIPTVGLSSSILIFVKSEDLSLNKRSQIQAHVVRLIWTLLLLAGTLAGIRSVFILLVLVLFNSIGFICIHLFRWHNTRHKWQVVYLISLIIPSVQQMYELSSTTFISINGRAGSLSNPEIQTGLIMCVFTILISSPFVALTSIQQNMNSYFAVLATSFILTVFILFTPACFPYNGSWDKPTPQRFWVMHSQRIFHNEQGARQTDSGIFVLNLDRNSPESVYAYVKDLKHAVNLESDCNEYLLCGIPLFHTKYLSIMQNGSTWMPSSPPVFPEPLTFKINSKEYISSVLLRYNITVTGPDRIGLYLRCRHEAILVNISLVNDLQLLQDRLDSSTYVINFVQGKYSSDLTFTFDVKLPSDFNGRSIVDLAVTANFVHEETTEKTPYFLGFIEDFPSWADVTAWVGLYKSYVI